jgi:hypothetical protein
MFRALFGVQFVFVGLSHVGMTQRVYHACLVGFVGSTKPWQVVVLVCLCICVAVLGSAPRTVVTQQSLVGPCELVGACKPWVWGRG